VVVLDECDVPSTSAARCSHSIERNKRGRDPGLVGPSTSAITEQERRRRNKGKGILKVVDVRSEDVVDLTSPTQAKSSADLDVQIVRTVTKIRKQARPGSAAIRASRYQAPLPDVFIAEDSNQNKKKRKGKTSSASNNACAVDATRENGASNGGQLECRICIDKLKEPAATPCGHVFCHKCIMASLKVKKECPLCRKPIRYNKQIHRLFL